jgi:hypothetical protein
MMAKLTMFFGVLLIVISVGFWMATGRAEIAALHPAGVGLILLVSGALANSEDAKKRMLWMHIAVTFGLIGFLITGIRAVVTAAHGSAAIAANQLAFDERVVVALICLIFVILCVRSFIAARRSRVG